MSTNTPRPRLDSVAPRDGEERTTIRPRLASEPSDRTALAIKIERAEQLLRSLPPTDDRARLLGMALIRRDESLLDALLREPSNVK